jgi:hypothetical protein
LRINAATPSDFAGFFLLENAARQQGELSEGCGEGIFLQSFVPWSFSTVLEKQGGSGIYSGIARGPFRIPLERPSAFDRIVFRRQGIERCNTLSQQSLLASR